MFGWEKLAKHHYWMTEARNTMFEHQTAGPGSAWWYCRILLPLQLINCCIGTYLSRKCSFLCCHFRLKLFSGMDLENGSLVLRVVWSCLLLSESSKSEVVFLNAALYQSVKNCRRALNKDHPGLVWVFIVSFLFPCVFISCTFQNKLSTCTYVWCTCRENFVKWFLNLGLKFCQRLKKTELSAKNEYTWWR